MGEGKASRPRIVFRRRDDRCGAGCFFDVLLMVSEKLLEARRLAVCTLMWPVAAGSALWSPRWSLIY